jgi:hypothetical protein
MWRWNVVGFQMYRRNSKCTGW